MSRMFKAYPSAQLPYGEWEQLTPLRIDSVEQDTTAKPGGPSLLCLLEGNWCFRADEPMTVLFHFNMLWQTPPAGSFMAARIFINGSEAVGTDLYLAIGVGDLDVPHPVAKAGSPPASLAHGNQGLNVSLIANLNAGDYVQACPCLSSGGVLCNSMGCNPPQANGGVPHATCNFFSGVIF